MNDIIVRPHGSRTHQAYQWQFLMANLSRPEHNPIHKRMNHSRAEIRRRLGAAKYREHAAGKPVRGRSPVWTIYDETLMFRELANGYIDNVRAIDAERITRQYPAMPEPK